MKVLNAWIERALCAGLAVVASAAASAQVVERLSVSSNGVEANGHSRPLGASDDGRFVLIQTAATNLTPTDTNGARRDAILIDRVTQSRTLVSVDGNGAQFGLGLISNPVNNFLLKGAAISADGSTVVYLTANAAGQYLGVYDRIAGTNTILYQHGSMWSFYAVDISGDGRFIIFCVQDFATPVERVFVIDRLSPTPVEVLNATGMSGTLNTRLRLGQMSRDGRYFSYRQAENTNLSAFNEFRRFDLATSSFETVAPAYGDPFGNRTTAGMSGNGRFVTYIQDAAFEGLYVRDMQTATSTRLTNYGGGLVEDDALVSDDGRWVAYSTMLNNVVPNDTNSSFDVFLWDRWSGAQTRVSEAAGGIQANLHSRIISWMSADSHQFILSSSASNLVPNDTNGFEDVFWIATCVPASADLDGDGFGAGPTQLMCTPLPVGWAFDHGDCDDTNPLRHPRASELCNGIDDDCDLAIDEGLVGAAYCTSATTPAGCRPQISATGCPSVAQPSGFVVRVDGCDGNRSGLILYGAGQATIPFAPGNPSRLCFVAPRQRMEAQLTGGTTGLCNGSLATDFLTWTSVHPGALFTPLVAGQALNFQGWVREPAFPRNTVLSNAWSVTLAP